MPDNDVQTIEDLIYYQYAKIIAKSAFKDRNGISIKRNHYGFVKNKFLQLKNKKIFVSSFEREDWQFIECEKKCIYCNSHDTIEKDHIIPKSIQINDKCKNCDKIHSIHNQIWACKKCNLLKKTMGLYSFFKILHHENKKFYDLIPPLLEKKYLKIIYFCHMCAGTLQKQGFNKNGKITVLDIDYILQK